MSFGKLITQPFLVLTICCFAAILYVLRCADDARARAGAWVALSALILLFSLSVPSVAWSLERIIVIETEDPRAPEIIVVAGGGYAYSVGEEPRPISDDSVARVVDAVAWWQSNPDAMLVMAGDSGFERGEKTVPMAVQMKRLAESLGVPSSKIVVEQISTNTREHPVALNEVIGIPAGTTVGIVTSPWHLRRTRREFKRYYDRVVLPPSDGVRPDLSSLRMWFPRTETLSHSTSVIHEMIGMIWSEILYRLIGPPELGNGAAHRWNGNERSRRGGRTSSSDRGAVPGPAQPATISAHASS